ncbi:MAG: DUF4838 domain-containing protein [Pirellulales bacterium]|nr:DUF4838 domain-containing protein [Pirellulales bacterium]
MPRTTFFLIVPFCFCLSADRSPADELVLAEGGKSSYNIVVADDASPSTKHGATELQTFLEEISGAKLPIVSDRQDLGRREIILGDNAHLRAILPNIDLKSLGAEGYVIRAVGDRLMIAGGAPRGNMYGVYGLLEDHLGCRWFTPGVSRIPKRNRLVVGGIDDRQVPALEYREPFVFECFDGAWCARNRMNSSAGRLEEKHGGKVKFGDGFFVHTFNRLVPPEKYFDEHPEYFSLVKGQRLKQGTQLCCTNPEVVRICTEAVLEAMRKQPEAIVFSVSQNDCHNCCECPRCQELARREGTQMGPVLQLVNRVAEAVEKEFPDKIIETLAYQWTRRPPNTIRPRPNVVIRLCSIECCFSHPLETCDSEQSRGFRADLEAWAKIAPRLWMWSYATDFHHYLLPFPNQRVRGPNIRYFVAHNVKGIMQQDTYNTACGELSALGGYISAKCLWNPDYDPEKATDEFLAGYYGKAAEPIREYLDLLHDHVARHNIHVNIWAKCDSPHLPDELLKRADVLWQRAEELVASDPETLHRVQLSRMSVDYAILERGRAEARRNSSVQEGLLPLAVERFGPFFENLKNSSLSRLNEGELLDKDEYRREMARALRLPEN